MKNLVRLFSMLTVISIIFASCGNDEEQPSDKNELLCREWQVISIDDMILTDIGDIQYFYKFEKNGNFTINLISEGMSVNLTGKWKWTDNENKLELEVEDETQVLKLQKLTSQEFWFNSFDVDYEKDILVKCEPKQ